MKSIVLLFASCILLSMSALAQNEPSADLQDSPIKKNVFQFSPIHLLASQFKLGYERFFGKSANSVLLLGGIILKESDYETRVGGTGELHFRISILHKNHPHSSITLFSGPFFKYKYLEIDNQYYYGYPSSSITTIYTGTVGVMVGLGLSIVEKVNFNFYFGGGAKYSEVSEPGGYTSIIEPGYTGIVPEAGFLFGFKF